MFDTAARELRWHYQWSVLDEFLPSLVGRPLVDELLSEGPRWSRPDGSVFIPLEFADAAYRYGHSQIRQRYQLNCTADPVPLFPNLLGFRPVSRDGAVDWTLFFDAPGSAMAQRAKRIDGRLGPVGGRIVAEVIIGLLDRDPTSVRAADAGWRPRRRLIDLLPPSAVASNAG